MNIVASSSIQDYFKKLQEQTRICYTLAEEARKQGLDPESEVNIPLAKNMAERVVGLVSVVAPQLTGTQLTQRIIELEQQYGLLDWRVGFTIAVEVAKQQFCSFSDKREAMEIGIRVGFAYLTLGIVSAPLEGFIGLKIKKRQDGKEYFSLQYAGPIRGAGGTAASTSVILGDYVRISMGYAPYDPTEQEVLRNALEIHDYHERVTNLQYHPSDEELRFLLSHLPVEVGGDPTERIEVLTYRDLPRIETNQIRGGMALVVAEGLSQKAPKLWKRLSKWGKDFGLDWGWLNDFIKLKEQVHTKNVKKTNELPEQGKKVKPNNTFLMDLVAGRPILTYPLATGGFRLRYGRTRATGFSAAAVHPATLILLDNYIAIGTQLKMERPGKAATITVCETIDGPIVRLRDGTVLQCSTEEQAKGLRRQVEEILFLGDILFNYGDFSENGQLLVPPGYCPEWWALEVEKEIAIKFSTDGLLTTAADFLGVEKNNFKKYLSNPLQNTPSWEEARNISERLKTPLHPSYCPYWKLISQEELSVFLHWFRQGKIKEENGKTQKILLPFFSTEDIHIQGKKVLEKLGISHQVVGKESIVLWKTEAELLLCSFRIRTQGELSSHTIVEKILAQERFHDGLSVVNSISPFFFRDKAGTFIGARMGRPEKAKMREMTGSPQVMFPVGEEGDRLRSFQSALKVGKIKSTFPTFFCSLCVHETVYPRCELCLSETKPRYYCRTCGLCEKKTCRHGEGEPYTLKEIDISHHFSQALKTLGEKIPPALVKGIRGTSNKNHLVEHLAKGILRAKHAIYVNKDGTTRYDGTELPLTHFKAKEIKTSIEKLHELGYTHDKEGNPLVSEEQVMELKPQDIILPGYNSLDESAPRVLSRVAHFIDDLLLHFYKLPSFYNIKKENDLVGHLVIGLAPHISAGLIGRIIGFSETQGLLAHPMYHAGLRRDCFGKNTFIPLCRKGVWEIKKIGEVVEKLNPTEVVDHYGTKEVRVERIKTLGAQGNSVIVNNFTKHAPQPLVKIKTKLGRILIVTSNHKQVIYEKRKPKVVLTHQLKVKDVLAIPYCLKIPKKDHTEINLFLALADQEWVMVRGVNAACKEVKQEAKRYFSKREYDNYTSRDSYPIAFIKELYLRGRVTDLSRLCLAAKRDIVTLPPVIPITKEFLQIVGLYIAEGHSREVPGSLYQVYIAAENSEIRSFVQSNMLALFGLKITENKKDRLTYSSRILYYLFTLILKCGSSAYEKRIPPLFLNLPNEKLGYLLSGYFEGDGSVSRNVLRATFDTVSEGLLRDLDFVFGQMGIFVKNYTYTKLPGPRVREFYVKKGRAVPSFTITKGTIQSVFMKTFSQYIDFISSRKKNILSQLVLFRKASAITQEYTPSIMFDTIISIEPLAAEESYCLNVDGNMVIANSILTKQCDGDEACVMLLMDALLNFSRQYLPEKRGAKSVTSETIIYYQKGEEITTEKIGQLIDNLCKQHQEKVHHEGDYEILELSGYQAISFDKDTHKVGFYPITKFIRHSAPKELYEVTTSHGKITVTGDHSLFVTKGKKIFAKEVSNLQENEFVITLGKMSLPEKELSPLDCVSLIPEKCFFILDEKARQRIKESSPEKKKKLVKKWGNNFYRYVSGRRRSPLLFLKDCGITHDFSLVYGHTGKPIPRYLVIDSNFVRLSAYFISESYLKEGRTSEIVNTNPEIIEEIKLSLEAITAQKITVFWDKRVGKKHCARIRIPSLLKEVLIAFGHSPVRSGEKHLPPYIFTLPPHLKEIFLASYVRGDGHNYKEKKYNMLYSKSHYLAAELSLLAHSLGKKTSINKGNGVLQILFSDYNATDPWWPLQDFTKELSGALRKEGLEKQETHALLTNYYQKKRTKAASRFAFSRLVKLFKHPHNAQLGDLLIGLLDSEIRVERVRHIKKILSPFQYVYDLEVPKHQNFLCGPHPIFAHNTMDSPLVLTSILYPTEVDDQVHGLDVEWRYPLEFYEAALQMKSPWEVKYGRDQKKIAQLGDRLHSPLQYEGFGYTHPVDNINGGVQCSAYKTLPSMTEKLSGQMEIARKVRAVDADDVARLVIQKHFLRDIQGNLRRFSGQQFRCVKCNEKYRRPPLQSKCSACGGKLLFTVTEGSVLKYLQPSLQLAEEYDFSPYLKQVLGILKAHAERVFGKEKEKQVGLGSFT